MFDMGFYPQITKIIERCPPYSQRQSLLFTATWESKVEDLANQIIKEDRVLASIGELKLTACDDVKQHLFVCEEHEKKQLLAHIVKAFRDCKILVFTNTKVKTESMSEFCSQKCSVRSSFIHGDLTQERRVKVITGKPFIAVIILAKTCTFSFGRLQHWSQENYLCHWRRISRLR